MFKLLVIAAVLSVAAARPSILAPAILPAPVVRVGHVVHAVPAAVSHQSHTQIHSHPVITSVVAPVVPVVHSPWVHSHVVAAPLVAHPGSIVVHG